MFAWKPGKDPLIVPVRRPRWPLVNVQAVVTRSTCPDFDRAIYRVRRSITAIQYYTHGHLPQGPGFIVVPGPRAGPGQDGTQGMKTDRKQSQKKEKPSSDKTRPAHDPDTPHGTKDSTGGQSSDDSEEKYRILFETMAPGVFYQRKDGSLFDVNPAALRMFGLTYDQFIGKDSYDPQWRVISETGEVLAPEQHPSMIALLTGKPVRDMVAGVFNPERNDITWVRTNATPMFRPGETSPYQVFVTMDDITELRGVHTSLTESEEKFRELFTRMPAAVAIYEAVGDGEDFIFRDFNAAAEAIEGIKKSDLVGKRVSEVFPGVIEFGLFDVFRRVLKSGEAEYHPAAVYRDQRDPGTWRENWVYRLTSGEIIAIYYDITERKRAEEEIKKAYALVNETQAISRVGGWEYDLATKRITWTDEVYRIHGVGKEFDPYNISLNIEFYAPEYRGVVQEAFRRAVEHGEPYDLELELMPAEGGRIWVRTMGRPVKAGDRIVRISGNIIDITDRKTAEAALRESEERFSNAFGYAAIGMALVSPEGRWLRANQSICDIVGYSEHELQGMTFQDITHPDDLDSDLQYVHQMIAGEIRTYQMEKRYYHKLGHIVWVLLSVSLVRDDRGKPRYFISQIENITERKQAEKALQESEEKLALVMDGIPILIAYVDADLRYVYMNKAYADWYGRSREELIGKRVADLLEKDVFERALASYQAALHGEVVSLENNVRDAGGKERFVSVRLVPHFIGKKVSGFFATVIDITERKHAEMARDESRHFVQHILDATPNLVYIFDIQDHRNVYTNREVANYLGYSSEEIISMGPRLFEIILHPDDSERVAHHHATLGKAKDGEIIELEYRMKNAGGQWRWLRSRDTVFAHDKEGNVLQILGITDDITNQKNATEAILERDAYTRSLIEAAIDPLVTITKDGTIGDVNAATEHATGYSRAEMIGTDFSDYFIEPEKARAGYCQVFEKGTIRDFPLEIRHRDGHIMPVLYNAAMYQDSSGSIQGVFAAARDITYLKAAQDALQESEQKYRDLAELMPQIIFETDLCGRFTYANRFALNLFGYDPGELEKGLDISQMVVPEDADRARRNLAGIEHGKKSGNEYRFRLKNGNTFTGITYLSVIEKDGQPAGFRGIIVDITERKHNEDVLRLSHFLLDSANRTRELPALLQSYIPVIKDYSGCEAIGVRILDEKGNIPYQAYTGFPEEFYATESPLSIKSDECMCIYVIRGTTDPTQPFFTPGGSFYMNGTTKFLATVSEEARGRTRNVCKLTGYESVALVPIRQGDTIIGLVHLADRRENMVPLTTVQVIEEIANPMGSAIQRVAAEKQVRESLEEKEVLLREIHHRVKNNLARVISLIGLQKAQLSDPEDVARFRDLESRIRSMSLVHESLYHSRSFSRINVQTYVEDLVQHLIQSYGPRAEIRWEIRMGDVVLPIDTAIHCGLIITEIVTNSLKYAFPEGWSCRKERGEECRISLSMNEKDGFIILNASDNGRGIPPGTVVPGPRSLGLSLIRILAKNQLHGDLEMDTTHGTSFVVRFVKKPDRESDFYAG